MADGPLQTQTFLDILTVLVFLLLDFNLLSCPGICNVYSVCILILYSSPSRRISHGDANLTHLRLNQLLSESESRGCGSWRGNHKNLMQDFRQICASRHVLVRVFAFLGLQLFRSAAIPREALF